MCTIVLAWQVFEDSPVAIAANRDEFLDRPAEPPRRREWETTVLAPKDQRAAGTWIGYNEHGVSVALTNRWTENSLKSDRSRGLLVRDALQYQRAEDAIRYVEREIDSRGYEGFNLLAVDPWSALLVEWDGKASVTQLTPGVHVIVNVGFDGNYRIPQGREEYGHQQATNANALRAALTPEPGENGAEWIDRAGAAVGDHEFGVCIHRDSFGTRSSSLIRLSTEGLSYKYANGPPCETAFESITVDIPIPEL